MSFRFEMITFVVFAFLYYKLGPGDDATGDALVIDGVTFPPDLKMGGVRQQVTGGGTRTKYGVAKVYAVALYMDSRGAASALKQYAGATPPTKQPFFDAVIKGQFAKTLFLQFHRTVEGSVVAGALSDSLSSRLPAAVVSKFRDALLAVAPGDVAKGATLFFMCGKSNLLVAASLTTAPQTVNDKGCCAALLDVFYGKDPISPPAKAGMAAGFASRFYSEPPAK